MSLVGARLHRTGTIFSRIDNLIKSGVISYDDRPLWYDVYKAFPPIREPKYINDPKPDELGLVNVEDNVRPIFYKEDQIRAKFLSLKKHPKGTPFCMLHDENINTPTPLLTSFVSDVENLQKQSPELSEDEAFAQVISRSKYHTSEDVQSDDATEGSRTQPVVK